jgi:hypothetical protein
MYTNKAVQRNKRCIVADKYTMWAEVGFSDTKPVGTWSKIAV